MSIMQGMMTEAEAAEALGFSHNWLRNQRLAGDGPVYSKIGGRVFYDPEDVKAWVAAQKKQPKARKVKAEKPVAAKKPSAKVAIDGGKV
jgi:hypothetical protein